MVKRKVGALEKVEADLAALQDKIRRDPPSYREDFKAQYTQYQSFRSIVLTAPASATHESIVSLRDQIDFVTHVAACYPDLTSQFPAELLDLLANHHDALPAELREKLVTSLVLLRKKELLDSPALLRALFPILVSTSSKSMRTLLYQKILTDIRMANSKTPAQKLNRSVQTDLHHLITQDRASAKGIWAVRITKELWRRQVWTDAKAVEIMKEAALAENVKVVTGGVNFFLGGDKEREEHAEEASSDEETTIDMGKLKHQAGVNKKSRKSQRELKNAAASVKKRDRKKNQPHPLNFSALHLLHDPQGFAEALFSRHLQSPKSMLNLSQKLQVLQLVSRLVGLHKLTIMPLYSYFQKYLTPRQASVTSFLASLAQATHNLVPPDALEPLIIKIANEFVSEASSGPVAAAGVNAIREICARQPLAMNDTLLQDLVMYRKSKDKSVMMAAKGLMSLYREVGPEMLKRRDRGREAAIATRSGEKKQVRFGEEDVGKIAGLDLLQAYKEEERRKKLEEQGLDPDAANALAEDPEKEDAAGWNNWDVSSDSSSDSGGWIDVSSEGEDIEVSDSEDENEKKSQPPAKKRKLSPAPTADAIETATEPKTSQDNELAPEQEVPIDPSTYATTRILTPADLAQLNSLRTSSSILANLPKHARRRALAAQAREKSSARPTDPSSNYNENALTAADLEDLSRIGERATKEEKIAAAKGDREERGKHLGKEAKRKERKREQGKSSSNREKERKKNFLMTLGKVRGKGKRSLKDVGRELKMKKGGKKGKKK
ncbi:MAG: hypothetical protein Q9159_004557 [Coniocarpon cinnabarinum]